MKDMGAEGEVGVAMSFSKVAPRHSTHITDTIATCRDTKNTECSLMKVSRLLFPVFLAAEPYIKQLI